MADKHFSNPEHNTEKEIPSWRPQKTWYGVNLLGLFRKPGFGNDLRATGQFEEEHFQWLRDWGFNFARLPMDYRHFDREDGYLTVDKAIEWGTQYGIHIQICLHHAPGFAILPEKGEINDLNTNPESQKAFIQLWRTFAKRYAGIPNENLSFNPLNEPCGFSTEQYEHVFGDVLRAIREEDAQRFVMFDGNCVASQPVPLFMNFKSTGQAFRGYTPHAISHFGASYIHDQPKGTPEWPCVPGAEDNPDCWIWEQPEKTMEKYSWLFDYDYPIMIGEFGCYNKIPHETCLKWMEHCLNLWTAKNLGWAIWNMNGAFGFLDSERTDVKYEDFHSHKLDRRMLDLLQRHMK